MHIHILGIAGTMTAPLAIALKKAGHEVSGSDQKKIYPPFSTQLRRANITLNQSPINKDIDLAIIGSSFQAFSQCRQEYQEIINQKIPYISATNYIAQNLIKANSLLVAGSYGKTTTTAAAAWLLHQAKYQPAFMFGGQSLNRLPSLSFSSSDCSVVEADESINGLDTQAKFLYYPVKYLILTSANWEHTESYSSAEANFNAFKQLISRIPADGLLIYNQNDASLKKLIPFAKCKTYPYTYTKINNQYLIGDHNRNNLAAVETLGKVLNIPDSTISNSLKSFRGIKRRLQLLAEKKGIKFYDDFAQSYERINAAISTIQHTYPRSRIHVFFEIHASFLQQKSQLERLKTIFEKCRETVIFQLNFNQRQSSQNRLSASEICRLIPKSTYIPLPSDLVKHYQSQLQNGDVLIHFSSGGLLGLNTLQKIIRSFS